MSCQSHATSAITSEALYPCLCMPHSSSNLWPLIFLLLWLMGEEWWPFRKSEQSRGFVDSVRCSLPADGRPHGMCSEQPGHLHPKHGQIVVKMVLITPRATTQLTWESCSMSSHQLHCCFPQLVWKEKRSPLWVGRNLMSPGIAQIHFQVRCSAPCPHVDQLLIQWLASRSSKEETRTAIPVYGAF